MRFLKALGRVGRAMRSFFVGVGRVVLEPGRIARDVGPTAGALALQAAAGKGGSRLVAFLAGGALGLVGALLATYLLHKASRALGG